MAQTNLPSLNIEAQEQFTVSYELLCLLQWLMEYETDKLKKIIAKALDKGLHKQVLHKDQAQQIQSTDDIQRIISDFLATLELLFIETIQEQDMKKIIENNLLPALNRIDSRLCDDATVRISAEKASSTSHDGSVRQAQEVLFQEILRRWKPTKKTIVN
jgi:hypothetical protein